MTLRSVLLGLPAVLDTLPAVGAAAVVAATVLGLGERDRRDGARRFYTVVLVAGLAVWGGLAALDAAGNVARFRAWDFPAFYVAARAAVHGLAFYDPRVLVQVQHAQAAAAGVPGEWLNEVGFWYLPPTMLLLAPLGLLSFRIAMVVHYLVQGLLLVGSAVMLGSRRDRGPRLDAIAGALLLMLLFLPTDRTIEFAQIEFGCLFGLCLAESLVDRSALAAGAALALGFCFKHLLIVPIALLLVVGRGRERATGGWALVGLGALLGAAMVAFGPHVLADWARFGPGARSAALAVDPVQQSLLALAYRDLHALPRGGGLHALLFPPFVAAALVLGITTAIVLWRRPDGPRAERWALMTSLALACFPNTHFSTLTLMIPALLALHAGLVRRGMGVIAAGIAIALVYVGVGAVPSQAGWAVVACWLATAALLVLAPRAEAARQPERPTAAWPPASVAPPLRSGGASS